MKKIDTTKTKKSSFPVQTILQKAEVKSFKRQETKKAKDFAEAQKRIKQFLKVKSKIPLSKGERNGEFIFSDPNREFVLLVQARGFSVNSDVPPTIFLTHIDGTRVTNPDIIENLADLYEAVKKFRKKPAKEKDSLTQPKKSTFWTKFVLNNL